MEIIMNDVGRYAFYFYEDKLQDGEINLAITDLEYFKQEGYMSDWELSPLIEVPDFMYEVSSGVFVSSKDKPKTVSVLKKLGFVEDEAFTASMDALNQTKSSAPKLK